MANIALPEGIEASVHKAGSWRWYRDQVLIQLKLEKIVGHTFEPSYAAKYLGISRARMQQLIAANRLRHYPIGPRGMIPLADVKAYEEYLASGDVPVGRGNKAEPFFLPATR